MPLTDEEIQAQQRAVELNRKIRGKVPTPPLDTPQQSLGSVLQSGDVRWKYSDSGAGGALLAIPNTPEDSGAAIKMEHVAMVKKSEMVSKIMDGFYQNAEGPPPFAGPRATVYHWQDFQQDNQLAQGLLGHLDQVDLTTPNFVGFKADGINRSKDDLRDAMQGNAMTTGVLVMEFAKGTQMNDLPVEDKLALMKSEAFAHSVGRAIAPSMMLGLTDHLGINGGGVIPGDAYKTNVSNFMYDQETGQLSVIDYDTPYQELHPTDTDLIKYGSSDVHRRFADLRTYLEQSMASQENFDQAIENLANPRGPTTPLSAVMRGFWRPDGDSFFREEQEDAMDSLSPEDRRQFAINLMKGAIDGLEYVQKNQQALRTAVDNTRENIKGQQLDHFYTDAQLQDLENEMALLHPDDLRTRLDGLAQTNTENFNTAQRQKLTEHLETYLGDLEQKEAAIRERLDEVQRKIDRIKNHPTFGDTLKKAFTPKGHRPIAKLREEQGNLEHELEVIQGLKAEAPDTLLNLPMANLVARQQFQNNMRDVESQVTPPQQDIPQVDNQQVNNVQVGNIQVDHPDQVQIQVQDNVDVDADAPKQDTSDLILDLDDLDVDESVRAQLKAPPKDNRTQLREKIEADRLGLNRQRAKPRLRDTNPDIGQDKGGDTSHGTGHSVT